MDFIKRKLSVKKIDRSHGKPEEILSLNQQVEDLNEKSYERHYRKSQHGPHVPDRSKSRPRRNQPARAPPSFVKYGGPGLNVPGNVKQDPSANIFGASAVDIPPLPSNAHAHGDEVMSDYGRYRLRTLSNELVHESVHEGIDED